MNERPNCEVCNKPGGILLFADMIVCGLCYMKYDSTIKEEQRNRMMNL